MDCPSLSFNSSAGLLFSFLYRSLVSKSPPATNWETCIIFHFCLGLPSAGSTWKTFSPRRPVGGGEAKVWGSNSFCTCQTSGLLSFFSIFLPASMLIPGVVTGQVDGAGKQLIDRSGGIGLALQPP